MSTAPRFPQADFLDWLAQPAASKHAASLPTPLRTMLVATDGSAQWTPAAAHLCRLLQARQAMWQAALDSTLSQDELRRHQKFARPGAPSPHIVQLRQQQAAARHASNQSRQAFNQSAAAFMHETGIKQAPRTTLEAFMIGWIEHQLPQDFPPRSA